MTKLESLASYLQKIAKNYVLEDEDTLIIVMHSKHTQQNISIYFSNHSPSTAKFKLQVSDVWFYPHHSLFYRWTVAPSGSTTSVVAALEPSFKWERLTTLDLAYSSLRDLTQYTYHHEEKVALHLSVATSWVETDCTPVLTKLEVDGKLTEVLSSITTNSPVLTCVDQHILTSPLVANVQATLTARHTYKGKEYVVTKDITVLKSELRPEALVIQGATTIAAKSIATYTAFLQYSISQLNRQVATTWKVSPDLHQLSDGTLQVAAVDEDQELQITAYYTENNQELTATLVVQVIADKVLELLVSGDTVVAENTSSSYTAVLLVEREGGISRNYLDTVQWTTTAGNISEAGVFTAPKVAQDTSVVLTATFKQFTVKYLITVLDVPQLVHLDLNFPQLLSGEVNSNLPAQLTRVGENNAYTVNPNYHLTLLALDLETEIPLTTPVLVRGEIYATYTEHEEIVSSPRANVTLELKIHSFDAGA